MAKKKARKKNKKIAEKVTLKKESAKKESGSVLVKKTKIRVIGIGGGAGNIVSEIASRLQKGEQPVKASFVVANTDRQALRSTNRNTLRFPFGENFTHGLGAGMNWELAEAAAQDEKERIKKLFQGQDFCILVASLGGGTGSGATPVFARIARNLGVITFGVFTLPFKFEGEKKLEIAKEALLKLKPSLNAISILPNERIFQIIDKDTPLKQAFSSINKTLSESLQGLIETIYLPGLINIDFADLRAILQGQGRPTFLNTVEINRADGVAELIKKILSNPLYPYTIRGAKGVMFDIAGEKAMSLNEVSQISKSISELANPEAKIIFGISENKKYQDKIKVTLLATGCAAKIFSEETKITKRISSKKKTRKKKSGGTVKIKRRKRRRINKKKRQVKSAKKSPKSKESALKKLAKRIRVKISPTPAEKEISAAGDEIPSSSSAAFSSQREEVKVRKNALQIRKETEEMEKEFLAKEQVWEPPAFLRLKNFRHPFNPPARPKE